MALTSVAGRTSRANICCAPPARQFVEGDVQHWWLPANSGQGVRTRIADDRVWLAYATAHYVEATGDLAVLDEMVAVSRGPGAASRRARSVLSARRLRRAGVALRALRAGARPEPPQSAATACRCSAPGDWNDGMNRVGEAGRAKASGSAGFCTPRSWRSRPWRAHATAERAAPRWRAHAAALSDVAGAGSLGRRLVPARLFRRWNAARIGHECRMPDRFHRAIVGRDFRGRRAVRAPSARWRPWTITSSAATRGWSCSSRRRLIRRSQTRATSKDIRRASAKTAANTHTPPSGR